MAALIDLAGARILEFSIYGTVWLLLLFLFRKKPGAKWQYFVSICIAAHLLVPIHIQWFSVDVPFWREAGQPVLQEAELSDKGGSERYSARTGDTGNLYEKELPLDRGSDSQIQDEILEGTEEEDALFVEKQEIIRKTGERSYFLSLIKGIWMIGMFFFFGKTGVSYFAFCKEIKRWSLPASPLSWQVLQQVKKQLGITRAVRLCRCSQINSPMLYGVFCPVILLPDQEYSSREFQYIFHHELIHYRHGDIWIKLLFTVCRGIYWFHPLVQWLYFHACAQMEFLCDEAVTAKRGMGEKREYSLVLLRHMSDFSRKVPFTAGFYGGKEYMKMRL
ncbi:M56 family metallopeptidase [bacterium D16-51]|nr:M56 family metallopeptidase [bacterium D16-59]RKI59333.1 M56 family metallopeptidase [bacterium D16-51]